eukprot:2208279-Amphidinium_carterae.1
MIAVIYPPSDEHAQFLNLVAVRPERAVTPKMWKFRPQGRKRSFAAPFQASLHTTAKWENRRVQSRSCAVSGQMQEQVTPQESKLNTWVQHFHLNSDVPIPEVTQHCLGP